MLSVVRLARIVVEQVNAIAVLDRPPFFDVVAVVVASNLYDEILWSVIGLVPVDVVDMMPRRNVDASVMQDFAVLQGVAILVRHRVIRSPYPDVAALHRVTAPSVASAFSALVVLLALQVPAMRAVIVRAIRVCKPTAPRTSLRRRNRHVLLAYFFSTTIPRCAIHKSGAHDIPSEKD